MGKTQCPLVFMDMQKNNSFCSICTVNYSAYAATLNDSLRSVGHNEKHYVLLVDYDPKYKEIIEKFNFTPVFLEQLEIPKVDELIKKYSAFELSNILKPFFMEWLLKNKRDINYLVYLDTDIYVYSKLNDAFNFLNDNGDISVLLTPHVKDYRTYNKTLDYNVETLYMQAGLYNGGFYLLKNNQNSFKFLDWQKNIMFDHGYNAPNVYMFVDQKILDFAPVIFDFVSVYKNKAYNVGHWNYKEYPFIYKEDNYFVSDSKLIFFHFSYLKIDERDEKKSLLCTICLGDNLALKKISYEYWDSLKKNNHKDISKIPYGYLNNYQEPPLSFINPLVTKEKELGLALQKLNSVKFELDTTKSQLDTTKSQLDTTKSQLDTTKSQLDTTKSQLDTTKSQLDLKVSELTAIYACRGWRMIVFLRKVLLIILPYSSTRRKIVRLFWMALRRPSEFLKKINRKIRILWTHQTKSLAEKSAQKVNLTELRELDNLSPRSRKIYAELKTAIENRNKNK